MCASQSCRNLSRLHHSQSCSVLHHLLPRIRSHLHCYCGYHGDIVWLSIVEGTILFHYSSPFIFSRDATSKWSQSRNFLNVSFRASCDSRANFLWNNILWDQQRYIVIESDNTYQEWQMPYICKTKFTGCLKCTHKSIGKLFSCQWTEHFTGSLSKQLMVIVKIINYHNCIRQPTRRLSSHRWSVSLL